MQTEHQRAKNQIKMEHMSLIKEMQLDKRERYRAMKERASKLQIEKIDQDHAEKREQLIKEQNKTYGELSKHETVLGEIKALRS